MSSHHFIFGLALVLVGAGALVFLLGQSSFITTLKAPLDTVLSGLGMETEKETSLSPYAGRVVIDFVSLGADVEGSETYIRLRVNPVITTSGGEYINVTGWSIVSSGPDVRIPKARDFQTASRSEGDIFLRGGSVLTIYAGGEGEAGENRRISDDEWVVWTGTQFLPFPHASLAIFDREGKEVDQYTY